VNLKQYFKYEVPDYAPLKPVEILVLNHLWMVEIYGNDEKRLNNNQLTHKQEIG